MLKGLSEHNLLVYLDSSAVLIAGHAIHLVHDEHVLVAHRLRRTYEEQASIINTKVFLDPKITSVSKCGKNFL